jgi:hypothetical protein
MAFPTKVDGDTIDADDWNSIAPGFVQRATLTDPTEYSNNTSSYTLVKTWSIPINTPSMLLALTHSLAAQKPSGGSSNVRIRINGITIKTHANPGTTWSTKTDKSYLIPISNTFINIGDTVNVELLIARGTGSVEDYVYVKDVEFSLYYLDYFTTTDHSD